MNRIAVTLVGALMALVTSAASAAPGTTVRGTIWVANEGGGSVTAIDAATNRVVTTLTGITGPHNVQVSPDGRSVWVTSHEGSYVAVLNSLTYGLRGHVSTGTGPAHVILTPDGRTAYVTNSMDGTVSAVDTKALKTTATIRVGAYPHGERPSPDGRWVYVANMKGTTVSAISTSTGRQVAAIQVGKAPVQVAFSPDGNYAYVSLNGENAVGKIDVTSRRLVAKTAAGSGPVQTFVTPDGKYLLVADQGSATKPARTLTVIDTGTFRRVASIETGTGAHGIAVDPSSAYAYVTNVDDGTVAVVDLHSLAVVAHVRVGKEPNGISFSSQTPAKPPAPVVNLALPKTEMPGMSMG
jgi:YVTN family beta-propeller protein